MSEFLILCLSLVVSLLLTFLAATFFFGAAAAFLTGAAFFAAGADLVAVAFLAGAVFFATGAATVGVEAALEPNLTFPEGPFGREKIFLSSPRAKAFEILVLKVASFNLAVAG